MAKVQSEGIQVVSPALEICHPAFGPTWMTLATYASGGMDGSNELRTKVAHHLSQHSQGHRLTALLGSGCSIKDNEPSGPSMKKLAEAVSRQTGFKQVATDLSIPEEIEDLEIFLSKCEIGKYFIPSKEKALSTFLAESKILIAQICNGFLPGFDLASHKKFLRCFARRGGRKTRLQVFTTNYDKCIESAASELGFVVIDGFSFALPRRFSPSWFDCELVERRGQAMENLEPVENLFQYYKLHGSVSWDTCGGTIEQREAPIEPCIIHPARTKYESSYHQPYLEMISRYLEALRRPDQTLIVIGFGFGDEHLCAPIRAALNSNSEFRLIVVDPYLRSKMDTKGNPPHSIYKELEEWRALQDARITFINGTFDDFMSVVPETYRPSEAEKLAAQVRKVIEVGNGK